MVIWIVFIIGNVIYLAQIHYISPIAAFLSNILGGKYALKFTDYSAADIYNSGYGITIGYLERFLSYIILFLNYKKISRIVDNKYTLNIFFNSFFLYFVINSYMSEYSIFVDRVATLFVFSYWILYTYFFYSFRVKWRKIFIVILFIFGILKMMKSNNIIIRNYQNVLTGVQTEESAKSVLSKHLDTILKK